jgi:hypothetical protein
MAFSCGSTVDSIGTSTHSGDLVYQPPQPDQPLATAGPVSSLTHVVNELTSLERATGIEPAYLAWEASALPLSYARMLREF